MLAGAANSTQRFPLKNSKNKEGITFISEELGL